MTQTKDSTTGEREEIARIIREKVTYSPHPWDNGRAGDLIGTIDAADAILSRPSRMAASSEGWVLVPAEPTEAMVNAAWKVPTFHSKPDPDDAYRAMLAARPDAGRVDPETLGDVSSLIAARCVALPGKLIDCPVCGAVDKERERLASVAVPVSEAKTLRKEVALWVSNAKERFCDVDHAADSILALTAALAVPDKGVQGDKGDMLSRDPGNDQCGSQPGADVGATAALAKGKSLGEKLHEACCPVVSVWARLPDDTRSVYEANALRFAASLSHDETASAVIATLEALSPASTVRGE